MLLKVSVSTPISSLELTWMRWVKSPLATRMAPSVRRWMGVTMVLDSRKDSRMAITRPKPSASTISTKIWSTRLDSTAVLSRM